LKTYNGILLHVFEYKDTSLHFPKELQDKVTFLRPGFLQHIAFNLPDEFTALKLESKLKSLQISVTEIMNQGSRRHMLFLDNNGIMLEASCIG
jgi:hypothetical protein